MDGGTATFRSDGESVMGVLLREGVCLFACGDKAMGVDDGV